MWKSREIDRYLLEIGMIMGDPDNPDDTHKILYCEYKESYTIVQLQGIDWLTTLRTEKVTIWERTDATPKVDPNISNRDTYRRFNGNRD